MARKGLASGEVTSVFVLALLFFVLSLLSSVFLLLSLLLTVVHPVVG